MTLRERFWGPPGQIRPKMRLMLLVFLGPLWLCNGILGFMALGDGRTWGAVFNPATAVIGLPLWLMFYLYPRYSDRNASADGMGGNVV